MIYSAALYSGTPPVFQLDSGIANIKCTSNVHTKLTGTRRLFFNLEVVSLILGTLLFAADRILYAVTEDDL